MDIVKFRKYECLAVGRNIPFSLKYLGEITFENVCDFIKLRVEPEGVNSFSGVFPTTQVIPISNFRPVSLLVFIL